MRHVRRSVLLAVAIATATLLAPTLAGAASYHSPGYQGTTKAPKTAPATATTTALPPVTVGGGNRPSVLVDAAGTAHIAWTTDDGDQADGLHYCQLKRGASTCTDQVTLRPEHPYGDGDGPDVNIESGGPKLFAVGDQLVMVSHRSATYFPHPDDSPTNDTTLIYTSEDGGTTWTGPAVVGTGQIGGVGAVFGSDTNPQIATIGHTFPAGTTFQALSPGSFTSESALLGDSPGNGNGSIGGESVAIDGGVPVAAFTSDDGSGLTVRRWTGQGDVNDVGTWSAPLAVSGSAPQLASGPSGLFLQGAGGGRISIRKITGTTIGPVSYASGTDPNVSESDTRFVQDPAGGLHEAWVDAFGLELNSAPKRGSWGAAPTTIDKTSASLSETDMGVAADGGGVAVAVQDGGAATEGPIVAVPFGTQAATGQLGLGGETGGQGGDTTATASCQKLTFGAVVARTQQGCFEHGLGSQKTTQVASGAIDLNGLTITPDGKASRRDAGAQAAGTTGVQILINPHQHTIDTTGPVTVTAAGAGLPAVTLWHGALHVKLPDASSGATLFDFPSSAYPTDVDGFPVVGDSAVKITKAGTKIPVTVRLPAELGSVEAHLVLETVPPGGLQLDSLDMTATDVGLGPVTVHSFALHYDRASQTWTGSVDGEVFDVDFTVAMTFVRGAFKHAHLSVSEYPGQLVYAPFDLYLDEVDLDLTLHPTVLVGGANFGAVPDGKPNFLVGARGQLTLGFSPFRIAIEGDGYIQGIPVTKSVLAYSSAGSATLDSELTLGNDDLGVNGHVHLGIVHKDFNGSIDANVCAFGGCVPVLQIAANHQGFLYCAGKVGSVSYDWGDVLPKLHPLSCDDDTYASPAGSRSAAVRAAGGAGFTVPDGATTFDVAVSGPASPAQLVLRGPDGAVIPLATVTDPGPAVATSAAGTTYIGLRSPAAGAYTVEPAGGASISAVQVSRGYAEPTVTSVKLGGHGRRRTLTYRVHTNPGVGVDFVERDAQGDRVIGVAQGTSGTIRFTPAGGAGGHRNIFARALSGGYARQLRKVASYVAPGPPKPSAPRHVKVRRTARGLKVTFTPGRNAAQTLVQVLLPQHARLSRLLSARARSVSVGGVARRVRATVTVTTIGATGDRSKAVRPTVPR